jgi:hypothetical protein
MAVLNFLTSTGVKELPAKTLLKTASNFFLRIIFGIKLLYAVIRKPASLFFKKSGGVYAGLQ